MEIRHLAECRLTGLQGEKGVVGSGDCSSLRQPYTACLRSISARAPQYNERATEDCD